MTVKSALNPGHMVPNSMEVFVAKKWSDTFLQLGLYKGQELAAAWETLEDVYSNGTIKKIKDWDKITLNIDVHELTVEKLEILQSWLVEVHPWTVTAEVERFAPGSWSFDKDILLKYANGDWSAISPTSVTVLMPGSSSETTLTASTDYEVVATMFGATAIKLNQGTHLPADAPTKGRITVTYSTTSNTAKVMEHKANTLATPFVMVLVNEYEFQWEKKTIKMYVDNCLASKAMLSQIADSDNTTVGFPVEITWNIVSQEFAGFSMETSSSSNSNEEEWE